jgi:ubiquinone/menaquinone biosynthesis C-methylase UbiE
VWSLAERLGHRPTVPRRAGEVTRPLCDDGAAMSDDVYSHGHHESVLRGHRWRTAENSAGYLLPHLRPGDHLLDVGCGPGTITLGLAAHVAPGEVVGIDVAEEITTEAVRTAEEAGCANVSFARGDAYSIDAAAGTFDVVHAHQVLQHLGDPIAALREMRRVLRPGGLLAVRDSDYGAFVWAPDDHRLDRWLQLYHRLTEHNGAQADAGRWLPTWVGAAGFADVTVTSSTWTFSDPADRQWWGELWAERVRFSSFATQAKDYGLSDDAELDELAAGFESWAQSPNGVFVVVHVEVLARTPT